jgi:hypothetical protein
MTCLHLQTNSRKAPLCETLSFWLKSWTFSSRCHICRFVLFFSAFLYFRLLSFSAISRFALIPSSIISFGMDSEPISS